MFWMLSWYWTMRISDLDQEIGHLLVSVTHCSSDLRQWSVVSTGPLGQWSIVSIRSDTCSWLLRPLQTTEENYFRNYLCVLWWVDEGECGIVLMGTHRISPHTVAEGGDEWIKRTKQFQHSKTQLHCSCLTMTFCRWSRVFVLPVSLLHWQRTFSFALNSLPPPQSPTPPLTQSLQVKTKTVAIEAWLETRGI